MIIGPKGRRCEDCANYGEHLDCFWNKRVWPCIDKDKYVRKRWKFWRPK